MNLKHKRTKEIRKEMFFDRVCRETDGYYEIPIIKKQDVDLRDLDLISFSDTRNNDKQNTHKGVHFYVDDIRFQGIYLHPERTLKKLLQYRFVLTPGFSLYSDMGNWQQIESIGKNRWCGNYWQKQGLIVVPTISWGLYQSFDFCFRGVERGSIVSVGMIGCKHSKRNFLRGYDQMIEVINPSAIICFGNPFKEMEGNVISVNYQNSRRGNR